MHYYYLSHRPSIGQYIGNDRDTGVCSVFTERGPEEPDGPESDCVPLCASIPAVDVIHYYPLLSIPAVEEFHYIRYYLYLLIALLITRYIIRLFAIVIIINIPLLSGGCHRPGRANCY